MNNQFIIDNINKLATLIDNFIILGNFNKWDFEDHNIEIVLDKAIDNQVRFMDYHKGLNVKETLEKLITVLCNDNISVKVFNFTLIRQGPKEVWVEFGINPSFDQIYLLCYIHNDTGIFNSYNIEELKDRYKEGSIRKWFQYSTNLDGIACEIKDSSYCTCIDDIPLTISNKYLIPEMSNVFKDIYIEYNKSKIDAAPEIKGRTLKYLCENYGKMKNPIRALRELHEQEYLYFVTEDNKDVNQDDLLFDICRLAKYDASNFVAERFISKFLSKAKSELDNMQTEKVAIIKSLADRVRIMCIGKCADERQVYRNLVDIILNNSANTDWLYKDLCNKVYNNGVVTIYVEQELLPYDEENGRPKFSSVVNSSFWTYHYYMVTASYEGVKWQGVITMSDYTSEGWN